MDPINLLMFGEFDDDEAMAVEDTERETGQENFDASLKERIAIHLAKTAAILKSQQRHEPDLTHDERIKLSSQLLQENPGQFLYRFGKYLHMEHLQYFSFFVDDPEVNYYLKELQKSLNVYTSRIQRKNRRFGALQKLRTSGSYFTEVEMKNREPLLYEELVGKNLTDEEKAEMSEQSMPPEASLSELLLHQIDKEHEEEKKNMLKEKDDDAIEEEDESDESDKSDGEDEMEEPLSGRGKILLKEEFYSSVYSGFVTGKDEEFDYSKVDECEEFDPMELHNRDEEERYFDEEEEEEKDEINFNQLSINCDEGNKKKS